MKKCIGKHFLWYYLFSGKKKIIFSSTDENLVLSKMYKFSTVLFQKKFSKIVYLAQHYFITKVKKNNKGGIYIHQFLIQNVIHLFLSYIFKTNIFFSIFILL